MLATLQAHNLLPQLPWQLWTYFSIVIQSQTFCVVGVLCARNFLNLLPWLSVQIFVVFFLSTPIHSSRTGADLGGGCRGCAPSPEMTCGFLIQLVFCKKKTMWFIGVEVEQETRAPPAKKNPESAPVGDMSLILQKCKSRQKLQLKNYSWCWYGLKKMMTIADRFNANL